MPLTLADDVAVLFEDYELPASVREAFEEWRNTTTASLGPAAQYTTPWNRPYDDPPALVTARRREIVDAITEAVTSDPPRSVLLVGEHGVGKTALVRAALDQLPETWSAFEATASSVNAGAMYIGQLEGRVEEIVTALRDKEIVWVFPAFHEALYAGTYSSNPTGLLDALAPHIESGAVRIVGETSPTAYERLIKERPSVASLVQAVRVRPLADEETTAVVRHALDTQATEIAVSDEVLTESLELAQQFIPGVAAPGNALQLLQAAVDDAVENGRSSLAGGDMLATLASLSGLPLAVLDPTRPLHLDDVRAFFEQRVLGQPEAIDCLVDRIALVKAGLTDPSRPLAVFLFVGPTGTGKTEIAKALAEFLFGSANRMVRLDMSEYQTSDSHERLLADANVDDGGAPLIASVRKDPFAVILLDEFEKAAQPIWDLFLQVFDDGRLTDKHGRTADFRRCVIILTSNVGSAIAGGAPASASSAPTPCSGPSRSSVPLARHFRPEFLNRLDRVVVFRPFERSQMHALLDKELADVTQRRGWRGRPWAVELDESAIAFLIEHGFSPELGARPLKRAVERHLLSPLARAIVAGKVPEGEQFLFVTAPNGEIEVTFVDPDADDAATDDVIVAEARDAGAPLSSDLPEVREPRRPSPHPGGRPGPPRGGLGAGCTSRERRRAGPQGERARGDQPARFLGGRPALRCDRRGRVPRPAGHRAADGAEAHGPARSARTGPRRRADEAARLPAVRARERSRRARDRRAARGLRPRATVDGIRPGRGPVRPAAGADVRGLGRAARDEGRGADDLRRRGRPRCQRPRLRCDPRAGIGDARARIGRRGLLASGRPSVMPSRSRSFHVCPGRPQAAPASCNSRTRRSRPPTSRPQSCAAISSIRPRSSATRRAATARVRSSGCSRATSTCTEPAGAYAPSNASTTVSARRFAAAARLAALTIARSEAVRIDPCTPTPQNASSSTSASTYAAACASARAGHRVLVVVADRDRDAERLRERVDERGERSVPLALDHPLLAVDANARGDLVGVLLARVRVGEELVRLRVVEVVLRERGQGARRRSALPHARR